MAGDKVKDKLYDTGLGDLQSRLVCGKCEIGLEPRPVNLTYMDHGFPVELPCCPRCGMVFVPEELARGKILRVEQQLEDK